MAMRSEYPIDWAIPKELDGKFFFERFCGYLKSVTAIDLVKTWKPLFEPSTIESRLNLLDASSDLLSQGITFPFSETTNDGLSALEERRTQVSQEQLIQWGRDLEKYINFIKELPLDNILRNHLILPNDQVLELNDEIYKVFGEGCEVLNRASSDLANIRKKISSQIRLNHRLAEELIRDPKYQSMLQEPIHVEHMGRQVLLWKTDFSGRIDGIRHGRSKSGQTTYFEPKPLMQANNYLMKLQEAEFSEVNRIVQNLFLQCLDVASQIIEVVKLSRWLDFCQAKVRYVDSFTYSCRPQYDAENFEILGMMHPAIDMPVAQNFTLLSPSRIVILSGPNAGGKTVCMKTLGVIVLHAALGLRVPARSCFMPKISKVLINLGDQQSLSDSLSSFSARLKQWRKIFKKADSESLILVDEIMNATDPMEGQILAEEICRHLQKIGVFALITTHFGQLKQLAQTNNYFENASMVFNDKSLKPTFELVMGTPGHSYAIELAQRFNLPTFIINSARKKLGKKHFQLSKILQAQKKKQLKLESLQEQSQQLVVVMQKLIEVAQDYLEKFENDRERILQKSLRNSRRKIHKVIRDLSDNSTVGNDPNNSSSKQERLDRKRREQIASSQQKKLKKVQQKIIKDHSKFGLNGDIDQGDTVMLIGYNKKGIVQKVYHDKSQALITLGQLEIEVALEDLEFVSKNQGSSSKSVKPRSKIDVDGVASMSLDLRGYSADDALVELDQFLDKALLGNLVSIKVITGKGVLENIIFDYLRGCSKNNGENKWSVSRRPGAFIISYD
ncbi:MAG: Smr/MutS family protein [bacterium]|nr:Smr/MutS family protein [bacterium]